MYWFVRKQLLSFFIALLFCAIPLYAASDVPLEWDPIVSGGIVGYKVHYGTTSGNYDSSIVIGNQTSYTVAGLSNGTYYFAVTAYDSGNNESGYSNEVTAEVSSSSDITPPVISGIAATDITVSGATIVWTTDEVSTTQVEYGPTLAYGNVTTLDTSLQTLHAKALTGLAPGTLYHYRVRSRDASENLAVSGDHTFMTLQPVDTTPPMISEVTVSQITETGARISWTTDEPADSQVEYGTTSAYGQITPLDTVLSTSHNVDLSGLDAGTEYHFRVLSKDEASNTGTSGNHSFTTVAETTATIIQASPNNDYIGITLVNSDSQPVSLELAAFDSAGNPVTVQGPTILNIDPGEQYQTIDKLLFPDSTSESGSNGLIRLEGSTSRIKGHFTAFNSDTFAFDGAVISQPVTSFILPVIEEFGKTTVRLANASSDPADVTIDLVNPDGIILSSLDRSINGNASISVDLFDDLFREITPSAGDYIRVTSTKALQAYELLESSAGEYGILNAQDVNSYNTRFHLPRYIYGAGWKSTLSIVNLDSRPGEVSINFVSGKFRKPKVYRRISIPANGKVQIDDSIFRYKPDRKTKNTGYTSFWDQNISYGGYVEVIGDGNMSNI